MQCKRVDYLVARILLFCSIFIMHCEVHNDEGIDLLHDFLWTDSAYIYTVTDSQVVTLDTIPSVDMNVHDRWEYYSLGSSSVGGLGGEEYGGSWECSVENISDSTVTITSTVADQRYHDVYKWDGNRYSGRSNGCIPLLFKDDSVSTPVLMDDGSATFTVHTTGNGNSVTVTSRKRVVNSRFGVLYAIESETWNIMSGSSSRKLLLRKNGYDCKAALLLDEYRKKEAILGGKAVLPWY